MRASPFPRLLLILLFMSLLGGCATLSPRDADRHQRVLRLEADAMHAYHGERNEQALALYREIVELDPEHERAWFRIGNLLAGEGDLSAALDAYNRALELNPDYTDARHNLALVHIRHGAALLEEARDTLAEEDPDAVYKADRFLAYLLAGLVRSVDLAVDCEQ